MTEEEQKPVPEKPLWQQATTDDVEGCDIDAPLAGLSSADCHTLNRAYQKAQDAVTGEEAAAQARRKVFAMLSSVLSMYHKEGETKQPYGAQMTLADGRRTALVEDFRGPPTQALVGAAEKTANVVLRARLSDVAWLLDRKLAASARTAMTSYIDIIEQVMAGTLKSEISPEGGLNTGEVSDAASRALAIARATGWEKPEALRAQEKLQWLRQEALKAKKWSAIRIYSNIDLRYAVTPPGEVGADVETALGDPSGEEYGHEFWRMAARAYGAANDDPARNRCMTKSADCLVAMSEKFKSSAMLSSHWLAMAIAELHGIPGSRGRRSELNHRLIDIQAKIPDEMTTFSEPIDLREIILEVERRAGGLNLRDALLFCAVMEKSPDPATLRAEAEEAIRAHPLSSLFGTSHHNRQGAVIHRTEGSGVGEGNEDAIQQKIAQGEGIRRQIHAHGQVDTLRRNVTAAHYLSPDTFKALLRHSPFIHQDQLGTYSRGFARFFEGDFISALYILTPLLENSLRHVLRQNGHDVSKFDDATQTQEDRTITSLFDHMRPQLDEAFGSPITTDISNVFLAHPGARLRHGVAHGLLSDGDSYGPDAIYACWLIFRLCCLPLLRIREEIFLPE